jgi:tRNA dimethylallyltransferase
MQVYRGLYIGTAKPSPNDAARVRHHLVDVVELDQSFDAARFVELAGKATEEISSRGKIPILCGGTGLYFRALLDGLGDAPAADPELRQQLERTPLADLLQELAERDPVTYERIDRQNPRRVIRAIEVIRSTGRPFSGQRADWQRTARRDELFPRCFGLVRAPADLRGRIDLRVEEMFHRGLVAETEALLQRGLAGNRTAMQALGYRQVTEHLRGERSLADTIELVKVRTRQFAKRQMTWFRRQMELEWIELEPTTSAGDAVSRIERFQ